MSELMAVDGFERLFRETASLDADKSDIRRMNDLVNRKLHALLVAAQGRAQAEGRDVIEAGDVPITAGLQQCMQTFQGLEERLEAETILDQLTTLPPIQLAFGDDLRERLPLIAGSLSVALARSLKALRPDVGKVDPADWDRIDEILQVVL